MKYTNKDRLSDFEWFKEHYNEFYQKYGISHIAIQNKTILGIYDNHVQAVNEISKVMPLGTFIVQFCNGDISGYTVYIY